jgi:hypothetical protein
MAAMDFLEGSSPLDGGVATRRDQRAGGREVLARQSQPRAINGEYEKLERQGRPLERCRPGMELGGLERLLRH